MKKTTQQISFEGEGEFQVPNQLIESGALTWDLEEEPILVALNDAPEKEEDYLGKVLNIVREDDGRIMAEIEWYDEVYPTTTIYAQPVTFDKERAEEEGLDWIATEARIRLVFTNAIVPWSPIHSLEESQS